MAQINESKPKGWVSRREFLKAVPGTAAALALGAAVPSTPASAAAPAPYTPPPGLLEAAKKEGKVVLYSGDAADTTLKWVEMFQKKVPGIDASEFLVEQEAKIAAKIAAEKDAGKINVDVVLMDGEMWMIDFQRKGLIMKYDAPSYSGYTDQFLSKPRGYYGPYHLELIGIAWNKNVVSDAEAPKGWMDLLNPKWKGKIATYGPAASSPFAQWYLLPNILPADFWERFREQKPRPYESSAQILDALSTGESPVAFSFNDVRIKTVTDKKLPVKWLWPNEGTVTSTSNIAVMAGARHPNAAKLFLDWYLSQEGQAIAEVGAAGYLTLRKDVAPGPYSPDVSKLKLLAVEDKVEYMKAVEKFAPAWKRIVGME